MGKKGQKLKNETENLSNTLVLQSKHIKASQHVTPWTDSFSIIEAAFHCIFNGMSCKMKKRNDDDVEL